MIDKNALPAVEFSLRMLAEQYGEHCWNDALDHQKKHRDQPAPPPCYPSERTAAALSRLLEACNTVPSKLVGPPTKPGYYWLISDGVSTLRCVYSGRRQFAGRLVVVVRGLSHTRSSEEEAPVTELAGEWFGPLQPPLCPASPIDEKAGQ